MSRSAAIAAFFLLAIAVCFGQDTSAPQNSAAAAPSGGASDASTMHGIIPVQLAKSIDSKKLKEGDEVGGKTIAALHTGSGILIPSGSKVIGHVTQSKAKSKGDPESSLGIVFDKIQAGSKDLPIKGVIQAVGPNPFDSGGPDTGAAGGGTMAAHGGDPTTMASPLSSPGAPIGQKPGQAGGQQSKILNAHSTGVVGIKNLELDSNSVLTSTNKEVKLDMGSQILIKAE
ncbi:MAG: hypothetical protein WA655_09075 [Candidatus Korobacteraceae bacterium]